MTRAWHGGGGGAGAVELGPAHAERLQVFLFPVQVELEVLRDLERLLIFSMPAPTRLACAVTPTLRVAV